MIDQPLTIDDYNDIANSMDGQSRNVARLIAKDCAGQRAKTLDDVVKYIYKDQDFDINHYSLEFLDDNLNLSDDNHVVLKYKEYDKSSVECAAAFFVICSLLFKDIENWADIQ